MTRSVDECIQAGDDTRMRRRRCLFVHPAIRLYRKDLFERLGSDGVEFLWTSRNRDAPHARLEVEAILRDFPYPNIQASDWSFLPFGNFSPDLRRVLSYDQIIFSGLTSLPFVALAPLLKLLRRRVVLFDELWNYPHGVRLYQAAYPALRFIARTCVSAVVTSGSRSKIFYRDHLGFPDSRIFVAYNSTADLSLKSIPPERECSIRDRVRALSHGRSVVLFLGRLIDVKGLDILIRSMMAVPTGACLLVVGDGPLKNAHQRLVTDLGLRERVFFLGACGNDEAVHYYRAADVFVLPSRFIKDSRVNCDSWGFTLNEAMSLGVPTIATTAVGGAYDLILHGVTGLQVPAGDPVALSEALTRVILDDTFRRAMGEAGRTHLARLSDKAVAYGAFKAALAMP